MRKALDAGAVVLSTANTLVAKTAWVVVRPNILIVRYGVLTKCV